MNVLITGGAGFIGSSLAKSLLKDGHDISIVDNFSTSRLSNILDIFNDITFMEMDLAALESECKVDIEYLISKADVVYHLAASIGVKLIHEEPSATLHNSLNINRNLFPLFEKYQTKVIFSSTSEVYGETRSSEGSKESDHLEIYPPNITRGSYACSKLMSEFLIKSYTFPNVITRFFNIVGPTQLPDYGHVVPRFMQQIEVGGHLTVYGNGQQVRSFCDIRDAVEMLKLLIDDIHDNEIYNIGNDKNKCTMNELADVCIRVVGDNNYVEHVPFDVAFGDQCGEIYIRYPNTDKIKQYYECKYSLEDILEGMLCEH